MQDAKEEVRARLNIEDVIGEYVALKRAGRNFKGLSPFTSERTPSFIVSPDKQIWHDFSSNRGGDIFSFIMEVEGLDFRGALESLAAKAGVDLTLYQSAGNQRFNDRKKQALRANKLAARYYQSALIKNQSAIDYIVKKRGLDKQIITDFQIGYAPDSSNALINLLKNKGFNEGELKASGLVNRFGGDLFRGRMMVPLMDPSGEVIGFTGRILQDEPNAPKYLNTPETLIYDKSRHVFALSQAKEAIRKETFVVIVEGNLDAISSHQAGVKQVVATAGTAMTEHHLKTLKRLTTDIRLCFDSDPAGLAATERAIAIASSMEINLSVIPLANTGAKDPDELIQQSKAEWQKAISQPTPAVDWVLEQYQKRFSISSANGKRQFTTEAIKLISELADSVERDHYYQEIARITNSSLEAVMHKAINNQAPAVALKDVKNSLDDNAPEPQLIRQDDILTLAAITPKAASLLSSMQIEDFAGEERQKLFQWINENGQLDAQALDKDLQSIETYVKIVLLRADTRFESLTESDRYQELTRLIRLTEQDKSQQKKDQLVKSLRDAESMGDEKAAQALREQLNALIKETMRAR